MDADQRSDIAKLLGDGAEFGAAMHIGQAPSAVGGAVNDYSCGGSEAMSIYLKRPEVRCACTCCAWS